MKNKDGKQKRLRIRSKKKTENEVGKKKFWIKIGKKVEKKGHRALI